MSEWQPIETAPKGGDVVFVWNGDFLTMASWSRDDGEWIDHAETGMTGCCFTDEPTHWMPLPDPPK